MTSAISLSQILSDNGNSALTIDSAGFVSLPALPAFEAVLTTGTGAVLYATANTEIVFNSTNLNNGSYYSTSTGRFTAPVAGQYAFFFFGMSTSVAYYSFRKNSAALPYYVSPYNYGAGAYWAAAAGSAIITLAANDYVSVWNSYSGGNGTGLYGGGNNHNCFCGFML
jgi:hypothetical protein